MEIRGTTGDRLDPASLYAILRLRSEVFVVEQNCAYPDLDGRDLRADTHHLWLDGPDGAPVAYLRVLAAPGGPVRIGRVCVAPAGRRRGLAGRLMAAALEIVGRREAVLDAQVYASALYAAYGFVAEGDEFLEDGIPHIRMRRRAP